MRAQGKSGRVDRIDQIAFQGVGFCADLTRQQFSGQRGPDQAT
jgi:hypothetical protein